MDCIQRQTLLLNVRADYNHTPDILKMPPMCQEQATVEYFKNVEVMMKIGPRLPCRQGHERLLLYSISPISCLCRDGRSAERCQEALVGSTLID